MKGTALLGGAATVHARKTVGPDVFAAAVAPLAEPRARANTAYVPSSVLIDR